MKRYKLLQLFIVLFIILPAMAVNQKPLLDTKKSQNQPAVGISNTPLDDKKSNENRNFQLDSHAITFICIPSNADIYIDSVLVQTGACTINLKSGTYKYSVEASQFQASSGEIVVSEKDLVLNVKLIPAVGSISINSMNETGARIFLDGTELFQTTPCVLHKIMSGEHRIQVTKLNYQPVSQIVNVVEGQTYNLEVLLKKSIKDLMVNGDEHSEHKSHNEKLTQDLKKLKVDMAFVKGGTFLMGTDHESYPNSAAAPQMPNTPKHEVTLNDFYIGKTEVTQALWTKIMGIDSYYQKNDSLPVSSVSWMKVEEFISSLNQLTGRHYRLPTEAEWEYAAGGGERVGTIFSGTNSEIELGEYAWTSENSNGTVHPVATKKPNKLGLYDMSGNVWEWCSDWLGPYSKEAQVNPQGATTGIRRVHRGGSWINFAFVSNVKRRGGYDENSFTTRFGFRLAMSVNK